MPQTAEAAPEPQPVTEDRRDARRYVVSWGSFCRLQPWPECRPERVLLHDISARGLGLVFREPPAVGAVLALQLPAGRSGAVRLIAAEVKQVSRLADGIWVVGCAFTEPLSDGAAEDVLRATDDSP